MKDFFTQKAFLLFTLLFVCIAASSFMAFTETNDVCTSAKETYQVAQPTRNSDMLWEMVSRQFLSLVRL